MGKLASHVQTTWVLSCLKVHSWDSEPSRGDLEAQHSVPSLGPGRGWPGHDALVAPHPPAFQDRGCGMCGGAFSGARPRQASLAMHTVCRQRLTSNQLKASLLCSPIPASQPGAGGWCWGHGDLDLAAGAGSAEPWGRSDGEGGVGGALSSQPAGVWTELDPSRRGLMWPSPQPWTFLPWRLRAYTWASGPQFTTLRYEKA